MYKSTSDNCRSLSMAIVQGATVADGIEGNDLSQGHSTGRCCTYIRQALNVSRCDEVTIDVPEGICHLNKIILTLFENYFPLKTVQLFQQKRCKVITTTINRLVWIGACIVEGSLEEQNWLNEYILK